MNLDQLTPQEIEIISEYKEIYKKLSIIESKMIDLKKDAIVLSDQLEELRKKDIKLFNNYGEK